MQKLAIMELSDDEQSLVGDAIDLIEAMVMSVVELRVPRAVPELVARLERIGEQAGVSQESATPEEGEPALLSQPSRETQSDAAEGLAGTRAGDSSLGDLDLGITRERRQRRLRAGNE